MNAKSLLPLLTALLIAPAAVPLLPATVRAQTTTETDAATLLEEANRLFQQGIEQLQLSQYQEALQFLREALEIYQAPTTRGAFPQASLRGERDALRNLGNVYSSLGQHQQAIDLHEQSLLIAREIEGNELLNLGDTYSDLEQYQEAIDSYEQALLIFRELGDRARQASILQKLGDLYRENRAWDESDAAYEQAYEQALILYQEIGDRISEAALLIHIVSLGYRGQGTSNRNIAYLQRASEIYQEVGDLTNAADALYSLGQIYRNLTANQDRLRPRTIEELEQNEEYYRLTIGAFQQALEIYQQQEKTQAMSEVLFDMGEIYRSSHRYVEALEAYEQALRYRQETDESDDEEIILYRIGQTHYELEQYEQALISYYSALEICEHLGEDCFDYSQGNFGDFDSNTNVGDLYNRIGEVYFQEEKYELALEAFQEAMVIVLNEFSYRFDDFEDIYENVFSSDLNTRELQISSSGRMIISAVNVALAYERLDQDIRAMQILEFLTRSDAEGYICWGYGDGWRNHETLVDNIRVAALRMESGDTESTRCYGGLGTAYALQASFFYEKKEYLTAITYYNGALENFIRLNDSLNVALVLNNLGVAYRDSGDYPQALSSYEEALELRRGIGDASGEATTLNNIGELHVSRGEYAQALEHYQAALEIFERENNTQGIAATYHNLGALHDELNQNTLALDFYDQALILRRRIDNQQGLGQTLNNIGLVLEEEGDFAQALDMYQQSLIASQQAENIIGEATTLNNIALLHVKMEQPGRGLDSINQALGIIQQVDDPAREGNMLDSLGTIYRDLGRYDDAMQAYQQALFLLRQADNRPIERAALSHIGSLLDVQGEAELAILFYKQSVNVTEGIRENIRSLPNDFQQSYTESVADTYRRLADLLLQQNRILEAQRVLDLLRVQELDDYLQDVRSTAESDIDYWQIETELLALYQQVLNEAAELRQLQSQPFDELTDSERERLSELRDASVAVQERFFDDFRDRPEVDAAIRLIRESTQGQNLELDSYAQLQDELQAMPQRTVVLYPLILENRLELVLVFPDAPPLRFPVNVSSTELNQAIVEFGQQLTTRDPNIEAIAQQLYTWLIEPMDETLTQQGVESIIYSPDGALRYIPLAALHDGEQYLAQRFSISHITADSLTDLADPPRENQRLLAAACADCSFSFTVAESPYNFSDLPFTETEVINLANQYPDASVLINQDFSLSDLEDRLGSSEIIHLATHAAFVTSLPQESFFVLGSGERISLRDIRRRWNLNHVGLIVLSACQTAVGSVELGSGIEFLGLGHQLQTAGAQSVIASLWQVSDDGTQVLMNAFYAALNNGYSKAESLQRAQIALITSDTSVLEGDRGDATIEIIDSRTGQPLERSTDLAHPYYWAPFILIGNGL
ncbi:tetratricopeptide repeat protein [Leptolyngbya sp. CCY15150]|uniref:CHAT domain-containing protein n=1 Tax=Leptolyngbya sp. CCY15150 TaxID=2767772 RepID=UPI00194F2DD1|nr:tetratricopeptide repeat protein [Leptolyngbya sp. CCY15150]